MATLAQRIADLVAAVGADIKAQTTAIGTLSGLTTTAKTNLVTAVNEVNAKPTGGFEIDITKAPYNADKTGVTECGGDNLNGNPYGPIQKAIDAIELVGGGTIRFPPGTYRINNAPVVCNNLTLLGYGATIIKTVGAPYTFFQANSRASGYGGAVKKLIMKGFEFKGDYSTGGVLGTGCVINLSHGQDVLFEDLVMNQTQGTGHSFDVNGSERITFRNCVWYGFKNPNYPPLGTATSRDMSAESIQLDSNTSGAIGDNGWQGTSYYDGIMTRDVVIENCKWLPITVGGIDYPCPNPLGSHGFVKGQYYTGIRFRNNLIVDPAEDITTGASSDTRTPLDLSGVIHLFGARDVVIENNTFRQTKSRANRAIAIISDWKQYDFATSTTLTKNTTPAAVAQGSNGVIIRNNHFSGFVQTTTGGAPPIIAVVADTNGNNQEVLIEGNTFRDSWISTSFPGDVVVSVDKANRVKIVNNTVVNCGKGFFFTSCVGGVVENNTLIDVPGIQCQVSGSEDFVVHGNVCRNHGREMLFNAIPKKMIITDNHFINGTGTTAGTAQGIDIRNAINFIICNNIIHRDTAGPSLSRGIFLFSDTTNLMANGLVKDNFVNGYAMRYTATQSGGTPGTTVFRKNLNYGTSPEPAASQSPLID